MESLAGKKEGCEDDVEFITVQRPVTASQEVGAVRCGAVRGGAGQVRVRSAQGERVDPVHAQANSYGETVRAVGARVIHVHVRARAGRRPRPRGPFLGSIAAAPLLTPHLPAPPAHPYLHPPSQDCVSSSDLLRSIANSNLSLNHPAAVALKWMEVPLGSVRVSLGWWSTFDDVYALGDWIERTYRDRTE